MHCPYPCLYPSRRRFIIRFVVAGAIAGEFAPAQAQARVEESDETAVALGYKHDTTAVNAAKYPQHKPAQRCSNCSFWQGKPADPWAGCAMFGRKQIAAAGWCQAWAKVPG